MGCCQTNTVLKHIGLTTDNPKYFVTSQWPRAEIFFIIHRVFWSLYHIVWIILSGTYQTYTWTTNDSQKVKWFIYLTNWSYLILTISAIYQMVTALVFYVKMRKQGGTWNPDTARSLLGGDEGMPTSLKIGWVLYNIASTAAVVVSILFWGLLAPNIKGDVPTVDINMHAINSVYVLIDLCVVATPIRILHLYQPMVFSLVYVIFSIIFEAADGYNSIEKPYIYKVLDWIYPNASSPLWAIVYAVLTVFVGIPVVHLVLYGLHRLRVWIFAKCCGDNSTESYELAGNRP